MSKSKEKKKLLFNFGRVFFPNNAKPSKYEPIPESILFQPLDNHVGNVKYLAERWKNFPSVDGSQQRVIIGINLHDIGKPQKFSITADINKKNGKFEKYIYSFKGHRFLATSPKLWEQTLARGHHDFSVQDICRDTYELKKVPEYKDWLIQDPLLYARELHILEMCDQIEAELACRVLQDEGQGESRTFMDCTIAKIDNNTYTLDPWVFDEELVTLKFNYWTKSLENEEKDKLQKLIDKDEAKLGATLDRIVKDWWTKLPNYPAWETKSITLIPLATDRQITQPIQNIYQKLGGFKFKPNPMQVDVYDAIINNDHPALLIKGKTGTGKTESVLFPILAKGDRLILPLPTRSLLEDQKLRIEQYLLKFSQLPENKGREISLVVDTGSQMYRYVYQNGEEISKNLTINSRRHLYKGDVILTTIDKFLYRYFAYGDNKKSFIFPLRISQEKTIICFDEAHSYDSISFTNFRSLVRALYEAGRSIILMTATMPDIKASEFDYLELIDYINELSNLEKITKFQQQELKRQYLDRRAFTWIDDLTRDPTNPEQFQTSFADIISQKYQSQPQRRYLAVLETVKDAVAVYLQLKQTLSNNTTLFLYHGRLAHQQRVKIYQKIQEFDRDEQPYILVTTHAIEVGCDLNSTDLITQICNPENLIQLVGRCNRKGNIADAHVIVVGDSIPDFIQNLTPSEWEKYQQTLSDLTSFDAAKIAECITNDRTIDDYRVVEMFSMLHDYVYNADLTCESAHKKGLVITRSWTPSATLVYDNGEHGDWVANMSQLPQVSVPIDRLIKKKDDSNFYAAVDVYERYYHVEQTRYQVRSLTWGSAYQKEIIIRIGKHDGIEIGMPYEYNSELGFVDLPGIFTKWRAKGSEQRLEYKTSSKNAKSTVINYIQGIPDRSVDLSIAI
jgi:CRISPR-associated endonuclease/helicase Cas3